LVDGTFSDILCGADEKPKVPVVVCCEFCDKDLYAEAIWLGAFDFVAYL
jgi:hypothetical protein